MIYKFPNPNLAPKNAPACMGGNLSPEMLISAYKQSYFPWFLENEPILWWTPDPRCVIFPNEIKVRKSTKPYLKKYEVKFSSNFESLINLCFEVRKKEGLTWLSQDIVKAYTELANLGIAHSVEVYDDGELVGGLYGLIFGKMFCGESMVSIKKEASKVALIYLCKTLEKYGFLIDSQVTNEHLLFMGARELERTDFLKLHKTLINDSLNLDFKNLKPIYN
ncbi:MAG: leucyl/phenylalanyl-tRNA--protein transferase [Campylobacteraceae bacterium]|nr:leucyl/phenylalanyl-tRNA--protein transferase [Campylobacteraceae bacterium]